MKPRLITALLFSLLTVCAFGQKKFDYGKVKKGKYINSFFGLKMDLPEDWVVQTKEQADRIMKLGADLTAGDDKNMKAVLEASDINTVNLITVFRYEMGAAVDYNPNFMLITENLKNAPGVKTGKDYLYHTRKLLTQSAFQYDYLDEEFEKKEISGRDFYLMKAGVTYSGLDIKQVHYVSVKDGFCLNLIISYVGDDQAEALEKVVKSIVFKK